MLYSQLLGKTKKEVPHDESSLNAQLLIRGGFIHKDMSGVYSFLPLGLRVMQKIIQIIREEMTAIGGQEVLLGSLQNPQVWQKSGRWDDEVIDIWFKTRLKNDTEIGLATTHEEPLSQLMTNQVYSYKDLPLYVYQFQTKFRNEMRAKSGLLRTREFIMKDLYSFNTDYESLDAFYESAKAAYFRVFDRLGLGDRTFLTFASGGAFSKYSHEFQTLCEVGEDTIYLDRTRKIAVNLEVYSDEVLAELDLKKDELEEVSSVEVGNIFKLGTRFSKPLGLYYMDQDAKKHPVIMGSYGIGPARCLATVVEVSHDDKGIIWPRSLAPFDVHLVGLGMDKAVVKETAFKVYEILKENRVEVLFDDRIDAGPGEKLGDADLIGIPYRLVISEKTGENVEVKKRGDTNNINIDTPTGFLEKLRYNV